MTMIRDQQDILKKKWAGVCEVYKATESNSHKASGRRIPPPTPQLGQILRVTSADINLSQDITTPKNAFKKALIVSETGERDLTLVSEADLVVTTKGQIIKSRWTEIPKHANIPPCCTHLGDVAVVLDLLSGDLNHNNVAQAKKILKDLLN